MLALIGGVDAVAPAPDYSKSIAQVYKEAAHDIIVKQGQMDILLAASGVDGDDSLPSCVSDWRCEANANKPTLLVNRHLMMKLYFWGSMDMVVLERHGYRAAGNSEASASFSDDLSVLTVLGQKFDTIAEVCKADVTDLHDGDFIEQCSGFVLQSKSALTKTRYGGFNRDKHTTDLPDTSNLMKTLTGGGTEERGTDHEKHHAATMTLHNTERTHWHRFSKCPTGRCGFYYLGLQFPHGASADR